MLNPFLECVAQWTKQDEHILRVLLVGFYARGTNKDTSDIDLIVVSTNKCDLLHAPNFIELFGTVENRQIEYYGKCTSIRVWYHIGMEAEFGIVEPSWLDLPLDSGTKKVLDDGYKIIIDKKGLLTGL